MTDGDDEMNATETENGNSTPGSETHPNRRHLTIPDFVRMRLPERYWETTWKKVSDFEEKSYIEGYLRKLSTHSLPEGWGLFLWGPPSTGKTSIAAIVAKEVARRGGKALFQNTSEYMELRGLEYDDEESLEHRAKTVDLLVLDEVDFRLMTPTDRRELSEVIRVRMDHRKSTILTTNDPGANLEDICGKEFVSMVKGTITPAHVVGFDFREAEKERVERALLEADGK